MYGISIALLLIASAVGYKVMVRANELKEGGILLKSIGIVLGLAIIVLSLIPVGCITYKVHFAKGYASWGKGCPYLCPHKIEKPAEE